MDVFEKIMIGNSQKLHFYQRNIRELFVCLFATSEDAILEPLQVKGKLKDAHISVIRCAIALILTDFGLEPKEVQKRLLKILKHILSSCTAADEWRLLIIIAELIYVARNETKWKVVLQDTIRKFIIIAEEQSFKIHSEISKAIRIGYVSLVADHHVDCPKCCNVKALGTIERKLFVASSALTFWPEDTPFAISPFMAKNNEFILVHLSSAVTSGRTVLARVKNAFFSMIGSATRTTHIDLESKRLLWEKPGTRR